VSFGLLGGGFCHSLKHSKPSESGGLRPGPVLGKYRHYCYAKAQSSHTDVCSLITRADARFMVNPEDNQPTESIHGDRRYDRRYGISLEVRWKLVRRRKVLDTGVGSTIDLSSGGILFDAGRPLPVGLGVELSISWPALLHNFAPMQLAVSGRIVRTDGSRIAVSMSQHEFRTTGVAPEGRPTPSAVRAPAAFLRPAAGKVGHVH
jgi:hypothetical protein